MTMEINAEILPEGSEGRVVVEGSGKARGRRWVSPWVTLNPNQDVDVTLSRE
ncbi:MAG: hypothetical protein HYY16_05050 [Planctomycetes bacterium]|nr:hypothetical protein [Planctomycetota bacterium]